MPTRVGPRGKKGAGGEGGAGAEAGEKMGSAGEKMSGAGEKMSSAGAEPGEKTSSAKPGEKMSSAPEGPKCVCLPLVGPPPDGPPRNVDLEKVLRKEKRWALRQCYLAAEERFRRRDEQC